MMPVFPSYNIKRRAKHSMRGKFFLSLGITVLPLVIIIAVTMAVICLVPGATDSIELIAKGQFESARARSQYAFTVLNNYMLAIHAFVILLGFLQVGSIRACIDIVRGKDVKLRSVFKFYNKWYIAAIWPLINFLFNYLTVSISNMALGMGRVGIIISLIMSFVSMGVWVLSLKFIFLEYALADNNCTSFIEAVKSAWGMTRFNSIVSYVMLFLSFAVWLLIMLFTSGLIFLYVYPYLQVSIAVLYDATRSFKKEEDNTP